MAQQPGYGAVGVQSTHAAVDEVLVLLCREGMAKLVEAKNEIRSQIRQKHDIIFLRAVVCATALFLRGKYHGTKE